MQIFTPDDTFLPVFLPIYIYIYLILRNQFCCYLSSSSFFNLLYLFIVLIFIFPPNYIDRPSL
jgi:hypothetical protein